MDQRLRESRNERIHKNKAASSSRPQPSVLVELLLDRPVTYVTIRLQVKSRNVVVKRS